MDKIDTHISVKQLKEFLNREDIKDDYKIWIEYPERYGLVTPIKIETKIWDDCGDESDLIECMSYGFDYENKRVVILHHF